ncbi:hypothetical protein [Ancylobacter polymorphus]|uniref:Uncharacterized protein n=1 Tax=Ancylobacter polymorphus TaxID=223390 RepID=A0ABU0BDC8_9HYPH|nr:hypothetical protein [Ancylobacter polymorphus]MDQ0303843.1 hypothetical protein [Ancylobacter polymorphus]
MTDPAKAGERELRQKAFIRVCRDSGFQLEAHRAAIIAAGVIGCHPFEMASAFGSMTVMAQIADGTHSAARDAEERADG